MQLRSRLTLHPNILGRSPIPVPQSPGPPVIPLLIENRNDPSEDNHAPSITPADVPSPPRDYTPETKETTKAVSMKKPDQSAPKQAPAKAVSMKDTAQAVAQKSPSKAVTKKAPDKAVSKKAPAHAVSKKASAKAVSKKAHGKAVSATRVGGNDECVCDSFVLDR